MSEALKPVGCGCGGEAVIETDHDTIQPVAPIDWKRVRCNKCNIRTTWRKSEAEAITTWNMAMGATDKNVGDKERTAKVIEHDASITDTDGYKYQRSEYLCGNCKKKVLGGDEYCSHCGVRLDWGEDIPMEYFESGGI